MNIQEAAVKVTVSADQIRHWERVGIIPPVKRDHEGLRQFNDEDLKWLEFAKTLNAMHVSKDFQIEYVKLARLGHQASPAREALVNEQLHELKQRHQMLVDEINQIEKLVEQHHAS